jgi:hypothetical protein
MTAEQGTAFLKALGATQIRVKDNGWIESSCVLARWTHASHRDTSPSFGLNITPGGRSYFMCFACRQGSAEELLSCMELYSKGQAHTFDFARCHEILADEVFVTPLPEYGEAPPAQVFTEWPQYWLDSFPPAQWVIDSALYLANRSVPLITVECFDLRYDAKRHMIVAPYRDVFNRLAGARGRAIRPEGQQHFDYTFQGINNARLVWYNEPVLNLPGPVVVVEGQFDCFRTSQAHPKTVANLTAKPTFEKMKKLGDCELVIQIPDRDEAGHQSVARYASLCQRLGLRHEVIYLDEGVKDPDECAVEYLKDKIQEVV